MNFYGDLKLVGICHVETHSGDSSNYQIFKLSGDLSNYQIFKLSGDLSNYQILNKDAFNGRKFLASYIGLTSFTRNIYILCQ